MTEGIRDGGYSDDRAYPEPTPEPTPFEKIMVGLGEALAFARGGIGKARVTRARASVDTRPKGQDAKQGLAGTESGAVGEAETPE